MTRACLPDPLQETDQDKHGRRNENMEVSSVECSDPDIQDRLAAAQGR